ncbi:hypothetical protein AYR56_09785 [Loigolactobacillus backii]|uniref:Calcineurin-like phosphoesterase domain-containing protein n=1 Tax=Loigolactobacillus backii TaxID=375175 RepID=A0A192H2X1_9LACO|nr:MULTISPECIES: metallophosphoesterase family protein [Loigolactobacillus]ANK62577.1 hypothetical protein AYR53_07220 [Loigolactobacillus backii]ANK70413.1 hypothetical protein AYR56_09785 [Loigolactobacillus backii]
MTKIAIISDSHGNATALAAVIADAKKHAADIYCSVGDITMRGPSPQECVDQLRAVNTKTWVLGNHEQTYRDLLTTGDTPIHGPKKTMALIFAQYDQQHLEPKTYHWLADLPLRQTITVAGFKIDVLHSLPKQTYGSSTQPTKPQENFDAIFAGSNSDIALYGHTHRQVFRYSSDGRLILNAGTVGLAAPSNPRFYNNRAQYALLDLDEHGVSDIDFRQVSYDVEAELKIARERKMPYYELYATILREGRYAYTVENINTINEANDYERIAANFLATF